MVSKEFKPIEHGFTVRQYKDYNEYTEHQKSKLAKIDWIDKYDTVYRECLRERLSEINIFDGVSVFSPSDKKVLCLAARVGTEVKAFKDLGAFAVGIDLNPGKDNQHVMYGDFHDIQFPDHCTDIVFTNSIDHSVEPTKMVAEIKRVLRSGGHFITELGRGEGDGGRGGGSWECLDWNKIDDVIKFIESQGFTHIYSKDFNSHGRYTWGGRFVVFEVQ